MSKGSSRRKEDTVMVRENYGQIKWSFYMNDRKWRFVGLALQDYIKAYNDSIRATKGFHEWVSEQPEFT